MTLWSGGGCLREIMHVKLSSGRGMEDGPVTLASFLSAGKLREARVHLIAFGPLGVQDGASPRVDPRRTGLWVAQDSARSLGSVPTECG